MTNICTHGGVCNSTGLNIKKFGECNLATRELQYSPVAASMQTVISLNRYNAGEQHRRGGSRHSLRLTRMRSGKLRRAKRPAQQLSTASASARGSARTRAATSDTFQSRCHRVPSARRRCRAGSDAAPTPSTSARDERRPRSRSTDTAGRRSAHGSGPGDGRRGAARTTQAGAPGLADGGGGGDGGEAAEDIGGGVALPLGMFRIAKEPAG
jgi:hypothetical protein